MYLKIPGNLSVMVPNTGVGRCQLEIYTAEYSDPAGELQFSVRCCGEIECGTLFLLDSVGVLRRRVWSLGICLLCSSRPEVHIKPYSSR